MSLREVLVQLGLVMIALGASLAAWALVTGPLGRFTKAFTSADDPADDDEESG